MRGEGESEGLRVRKGGRPGDGEQRRCRWTVRRRQVVPGRVRWKSQEVGRWHSDSRHLVRARYCATYALSLIPTTTRIF